MLNLISKNEAKAAALTRYFTGLKCKNGHISERRTASGHCLGCVNADVKAYSKKNPDKIYAYRKRTSTATRRIYRKRYEAKNRTRYLAAVKQKRIRYLEKNPSANYEGVKKWRANNPEALNAQTQVRRARKVNAPGRFNKKDILLLLKKQKQKCVYCLSDLSKGYHVDHRIALSRGGSNWPNNIQLLCKKCNLKKHAKDPIIFAQENGLLL